MAFFSSAALPVVVAVSIGFLVAVGLNELDNKFGYTDKLFEKIAAAQQEMGCYCSEIKEKHC